MMSRSRGSQTVPSAGRRDVPPRTQLCTLTRSTFTRSTLVIGALLLGSLVGCASTQFREQDRVGRWMTTLEQHLHAETARAAASHLADDFRATVHPGSVHLVTTGAADSGGPTSPDRSNLDRGAMLDLLDWEFALHRTITASDFRFDEASITATCFAENDLSRLVEFPGWETTVTWTFDGRGKIAGQVIAPARGSPDFRNWLAPAINWLRQHRPADLDWLAPDGLPPTAGNLSPRAAKRWVEVLTEWRGATDRRPIELHAPLKPAADAAR